MNECEQFTLFLVNIKQLPNHLFTSVSFVVKMPKIYKMNFFYERLQNNLLWFNVQMRVIALCHEREESEKNKTIQNVVLRQKKKTNNKKQISTVNCKIKGLFFIWSFLYQYHV
jgi:GTP-dependent phosphoenolpyruvate carboxykinase